MTKMPHGWYLLCGGDPEEIGNITIYLSLLDGPPWIPQRLLEEDEAVWNAMNWFAEQRQLASLMRHAAIHAVPIIPRFPSLP